MKDGEQSINSCLICYDNPPDTVIMDCGHGGSYLIKKIKISSNFNFKGLCNFCSTDIWKKNNECYLCRKVFNIKFVNNKKYLNSQLVQ